MLPRLCSESIIIDLGDPDGDRHDTQWGEVGPDRRDIP